MTLAVFYLMCLGDDTHEFTPPAADRASDAAGASRSDLWAAAKPPAGAPEHTAGPLTVDLRTGTQRGHDLSLLAVCGEIDLDTAPVLLETLLSVVEREAGPVVIDLSEVPFMDSTGVHVLIDTLRRLEPQNRRLAIACREDGQVHRLLAMTGLLDTLTVHPSRQRAVIAATTSSHGHEPRTSSQRSDDPDVVPPAAERPLATSRHR